MSFVSIVEYMHDLKEAGFTDKQSEVQARKLELVISEVKSDMRKGIKDELHLDELSTKQDLGLAIERIRLDGLTVKKDLDLALEKIRLDVLTTKQDLELAIEKIRYETLKFTVWTGVAVVMAMAGMLAKGFHWF